MNKKFAWLVAGLIGAASPALANPVTYTGYTVLNDQNVTLTDSALGLNESGGAGQITLTGTNTAGGSLSVWCVDISDYLQGSGSFGSGVTLSTAVAYDVNALITNGTPLLAGSFDASAALQSAIWQMEYGTALTISGSSSMLTLAQSYVTNVTNGTWAANPYAQVIVLDGQGSNQNQAYTVAVPEPSSLLIIGAGLFGFGLLTRRRTYRGD